jgi:hypothetical protein
MAIQTDILQTFLHSSNIYPFFVWRSLLFECSLMRALIFLTGICSDRRHFAPALFILYPATLFLINFIEETSSVPSRIGNS